MGEVSAELLSRSAFDGVLKAAGRLVDLLAAHDPESTQGAEAVVATALGGFGAWAGAGTGAAADAVAADLRVSCPRPPAPAPAPATQAPSAPPCSSLLTW